MKKTWFTIGLTVVVVLALWQFIFAPRKVSGSFAPVSNAFVIDEPYMETSAIEYPAPGVGGGDGSALKDAFSQNSAVTNVQERLVIRNADLAIVVKDPKADMERIGNLAADMGGFIVSSNLYQSYYGPNNLEVPEATVTIRVPVHKLDEALARVKETAVDINHENISGQDVTSEYVDLQSRLSAKQAAEKKLLQFLDEAEKTEDVLAVYSTLQSIQTEIEILKGQIKYYEESAAMSAISVRLIAEEGTQPITVGPWQPAGAAKEAVENLIRFSRNFVDFLIGLFIFVLPALIMLAIPLILVFFVGRAIFRKYRKSLTPMGTREEKEKK